MSETILCGDGVRRSVRQLREATSHREAYPEQYSHHAVGKRYARPDGTEGTIERVAAGSRFGTMAHFEGDGSTWQLLRLCTEVTR